MFRTTLKPRSYRQNVRLAIFLSATAGLVNSIGLMQTGILTTNVTGHFALFSESLVLPARHRPIIYCLYIISFFSGAWLAGWLNRSGPKRQNSNHPNPGIIIEMAILISVGSAGSLSVHAGLEPMIPAAFLLFAMGLQNALVSIISKTTVRTTHLTGVLTDLAVDLAQIRFVKSQQGRANLRENIGLRLLIIAFFTAGCLLGAAITPVLHFRALFVGAFLLLLAMQYHNVRIGLYRLQKRFIPMIHS